VGPELAIAPLIVNAANEETDPREGALAPKTSVFIASSRIAKIMKFFIGIIVNFVSLIIFIL
jgi:hypothetical protein